MNSHHRHYIALKTLLRKEIVRFLRIWSQTLLPPAITITLYFIIFGKMIGSQINDIQGFTYIEFIVPGLTMMSIMTNAYANTSSTFFSAKFSKSIEEMLVSSMPNYIILLGYILSGAFRGLLVGAIVLLIGCLFTQIEILHIWLVLVMAVSSALLFSTGGLINAIFAKKFDDVSFLPTFVLTPLTYLGGVFYSIQQLPTIWKTLSSLNPILYIVDGFRYGMLGVSDIPIFISIFIVLFLFIVLSIWAMYLLQKGVGLRS